MKKQLSGLGVRRTAEAKRWRPSHPGYSGITDQVGYIGTGVRGATGSIDDVGDGAGAAQGDGHKIVELNPGSIGHLKGMILHNAGIDVEVAVAAQTPGFVAGDRGSHLVSRVAIGAAVHPGRLVGWIIGQFILEKVSTPSIAVPDDLVLLIVLNEQA